MHNILLRYLDEVARQGSIRRAANVLHVASSAVNRQILKLEEELGTKLFHRTSDGVQLTPAGRAVVEHCRRTLYDFENLRTAVDDIRDLRSGHVRISTLDSLAFEFLPHALDEFLLHNPAISFSVTTAAPEDSIDAVAKDTADIGLSFTHLGHPNVRVVAEKSSPFGVVMLPNHPLADRQFLRLEDCLDFRLVRTIDARGKSSYVDQTTDMAARQLSSVFYTNSLVMAKYAIKANIGIGIYTKAGFLSEVDNGELRFLPLSDPSLSSYKIGVFISAQKNLDVAARLLVEVIEKKFRQVNFN